MVNNIYTLLATTVLLQAACQTARSQSTFQNLDFESATIVSAGFPDPAVVQFDPAFPGWTGLIGTNQQTIAHYNEGALDSSQITIIDSGWSAWPGTFGIPGPIEGAHSALLQAGLFGANPTPQDTFLFQTGVIPTGTKSLLFKAYSLGGTLRVSLAGQSLAYVPLQSSSTYTLFGADIEQYAGQVATLEFTLYTQRPHLYNVYAFLDSVTFSQTTIPEPTTVHLIIAGVILILMLHSGKRLS